MKSAISFPNSFKYLVQECRLILVHLLLGVAQKDVKSHVLAESVFVSSSFHMWLMIKKSYFNELSFFTSTLMSYMAVKES